MSYLELLQVIAASSLLTLALVLLLHTVWRLGRDRFQYLLPPRYLKARGVLRGSTLPPQSTPHE